MPEKVFCKRMAYNVDVAIESYLPASTTENIPQTQKQDRICVEVFESLTWKGIGLSVVGLGASLGERVSDMDMKVIIPTVAVTVVIFSASIASGLKAARMRTAHMVSLKE